MLTTSMTPTELVYGTPIRLFPSPVNKAKIPVPSVTDYIQRIEDSIAIARDRHVIAKTNQTSTCQIDVVDENLNTKLVISHI